MAQEYIECDLLENKSWEINDLIKRLEDIIDENARYTKIVVQEADRWYADDPFSLEVIGIN